MRLKTDYVLHQPREGETLAVATGEESNNFKGFMRANEAATFILKCLQEDTTEDAVLARMKEEYDADESILREDLQKIISQLREIGALEE